MNAGARAARGQLLAFLHADTRLGPTHLAALRQDGQKAQQALTNRHALFPALILGAAGPATGAGYRDGELG